MSDTAAEIVNLCDDTPRRPTKRSRPERPETKVLSLVESDDESPSSIPRPKDQAGQDSERHPRMLMHWGAIEDQGASPPMPVYRPPSARARRSGVAQQPRVNINPSPIVVDDEANDGDFVTRPSLIRHISGLVRQHTSSADNADNAFARPPLPPSLQRQHQHQQPPQQAVQGHGDVAVDLQYSVEGEFPWRPTVPGVRMGRRPFRVPLRNEAQGGFSHQASQQQQEQLEQARPLQVDVDGQEDADMRLAVRLQAEEDDRLAQEIARRLEQEEHRRMMGIRSAAAAAEAAAAAASGTAIASPAIARAVPSGHAWRLARAADGRSNAFPAELETGRIGVGTESSEAAAAALAARWSRLDMLETLENASLAEVTRRERERSSRRTERFGGSMAQASGRDSDYNQDVLPWRALPRPIRGPRSSSMALFGSPGAGSDTSRVAEAAALAAAAEEAAAAAAAAAASAAVSGGGRSSFASRPFSDMIPAMMGLPFGFHRIVGGRGDPDDNTGTQRRARHAATAYREHALAMREQILAAHRAGIPAHLLLSDRDFTPEDYELLCRLDENVENRKGAKEEQLAGLPTETVGADGRRRSDGSPATCTICMEEVAPGDILKRLPCLHEFHKDCVDTWLKTKACCPICQRELDPTS